MIPRDPQEQRLLIAEHVLGLTDGALAMEVERWLADDDEAARLASHWQEHWLAAASLLEPAPLPRPCGRVFANAPLMRCIVQGGGSGRGRACGKACQCGARSVPACWWPWSCCWGPCGSRHRCTPWSCRRRGKVPIRAGGLPCPIRVTCGSHRSRTLVTRLIAACNSGPWWTRPRGHDPWGWWSPVSR